MFIKGAKIEANSIEELMLEGVDLELVKKEMNQYGVFSEDEITKKSAIEFFVTENEETQVENAEVKGLGLVLKNNNQSAIEITRYENQKLNDVNFVTRATVVTKNDAQIVKHKLKFEDGELVHKNDVETTHPEITFYGEELLSDNEVSAANSDPDEFWGVPCFDVNPANAECCQFRYNGLPWKELVEYNYCGAGCTRSWLEPENPLDACCETHDSCYGRNFNSCACDYALLNCAEGTDEAGGSRLILAFEAKTRTGVCS
ncbi:hypothetical protein AAV35_013875 (plasmid) [Salimicrobium jeotgali]|uniref:Phospholipase A2 domain-containing protein n=1 Tax=Salimicrobium jeotgali TaxID=1230341 RepID=K2G8Z1_9BACI|nr:hypothetical protein [Salimicrobium jeotgali]AKG05821.1 hypothetical protein AAV35_013875 [Salimicrobium jeotgali]EKE30847.1 hypothetical protein MJ3_11395 [Salimicrobium jeotgali]MBM7697443.1 hypothetical protein [Salimicrobium jeotgali]